MKAKKKFRRSCYYITKQTIFAVGLTEKEADEIVAKYHGSGILEVKADPYIHESYSTLIKKHSSQEVKTK